ncbi:uncharacterized protein LOC110686626 isoform X1 [Chenopodium quinoa]|uniref:uncharacterized protein LOC110686626 isoform X1 n=1 Tax=Chenopodium quinoa TaxID=63459 RepID=UPI000B78B670|nr:uncharacterized protein LOC110686626 isoform X1 [Chenopodium quinoa]
MGLLSGTLRATWQPVMTGDTSTSKYWLNWRVLLCVILVLISMIFASFLISKHEGPRKSSKPNLDEEEISKEKPGILYADEVWMPCLKGMHPGWLLAFRVCAFFVLLILLIVNVIVDGGSIFYYYTQWTFTLVTIYFALGSVLSMYGCYDYHQKISGDRVHSEGIDAERGVYLVPMNGGTPNAIKASFSTQQILHRPRATAGFWGYVFQVIFQMNAGAVILTDCVFWFIIVPFLATKNYDLNFFIINMHTINLVFLLGDTALNCLRFPWFRIAYFILWTSFFVIFQWVLHACISIWWPYPFLDLSSSFAPLWYSSVAIMHFPCYGIFFLITKLKHNLLSKHFPMSYQCSR